MTMRGRIAPAVTAIGEAAGLLRAGDLVAFPTETVYGLGADATRDTAVAKIFAAKGRPQRNPLIVHVADADAAAALAHMPPAAEKLAQAFWPGALTIVLRRRAGCPVSAMATAGLDTVAIRIPDHSVALALLRAVALPIAAPSANPSGKVSPTTAQHVADGLGERVALILDGGPCRVGIESTVVAVEPHPVLLRPGTIGREALEAVLGAPVAVPAGGHDGPLLAPGQMESHYAPRAALRLNAVAAGAADGVLTFGAIALTGGAMRRNLSERGDLREAAANLYAALRELDAAGVAVIAVAPIPDTGIGRAINDRLRRAAAPRGA